MRSGLLFFALLVPSLFIHEDDFTFHGNGNTFTVVRWLICLVTDCWTRNSKGRASERVVSVKKKYLYLTTLKDVSSQWADPEIPLQLMVHLHWEKWVDRWVNYERRNM